MSPRRSDTTTGKAAKRSDDAASGIDAGADGEESEARESDTVDVLYTAARTAKLLLGALVSALTALKLLGVL